MDTNHEILGAMTATLLDANHRTHLLELRIQFNPFNSSGPIFTVSNAYQLVPFEAAQIDHRSRLQLHTSASDQSMDIFHLQTVVDLGPGVARAVRILPYGREAGTRGEVNDNKINAGKVDENRLFLEFVSAINRG